MKKKSKSCAILTLTGSLRDFSISGNRPLEITFELHPSVKDQIESKGVPHTAIFKLEINGKEKSLGYNLQDGDRITAYPFGVVDENQLDPIFVSPSDFILDVQLGKLTKTLRLLGFDASFDKNWDDKAIIQQSNQQQRMILTRDIELLKNGQTRYGYWMRSTDPDQQIRELFERFSLADKIDSFTRCMKCNGALHHVELKKVEDRVPPKVKEWHSQFWECSNCQQVYWKGSHYKKLKGKVDELRNTYS